MSFSVRFINNFQLTVVSTVLDKAGNLQTEINKYNVGHGDIHRINRYNTHPNTVDLFFIEEDPFQGVAMAVPKTHCEFLLPTSPSQRNKVVNNGSGCGGCNK